MASNGELRVPIGIPVDTNAGDAADSIEALRDRISASKDAIRDAAKSMGDLKGKTAEVTAAKDQLKAKLGEERAALAGMTAQLVQQGTSFEQLKSKQAAAAAAAEKLAKAEGELKSKTLDAGAAAKKAAKDEGDAAKASKNAAQEKSDAVGKGLGSVGGPAAGLKDKLDSLKDAFGGAGGGSAALAAGAAAAVLAIVALAAAAAAAVISLGKFIIVSADAARSQQLLRAAALNGNESWAKNLGDQVDLLATKVPLARDKINEIGISLSKNRIGGQTMVDTLNAVAQASSALGEDAGNKLKEFVERGRQMQRFQINPQELIGTGVDFDDVAKALAKSMHVGVLQARQALVEGRVKLADGAAALRDAVETKVGKINLRQMLSLENIAKKATEAFEALAKDVDLEPALNAMKEVMDIFSQSTTTGRALKEVVTRIGKAIVDGFTKGAPIAKAFIQGLIIGALKLENVYLQLAVAAAQLRETFGATDLLKNVDTLGWALKAGELAAFSLVAAIGLIGGVMAVGMAPILAIGAGLLWLHDVSLNVGKSIREFFLTTDWKATGLGIVDGIISGLKSGLALIQDAIGGLATGAIKTFRDKLGIRSPSKVFAELGVHTAAGFAQGVDEGSSDANASVGGMVDAPSAGKGSSGGGRGPVSVTFAPVIQLTGGGGSAAEQLADPALLEPLTRMFLQALRSAGLEEVTT